MVQREKVRDLCPAPQDLSCVHERLILTDRTPHILLPVPKQWLSSSPAKELRRMSMEREWPSRLSSYQVSKLPSVWPVLLHCIQPYAIAVHIHVLIFHLSDFLFAHRKSHHPREEPCVPVQPPSAGSGWEGKDPLCWNTCWACGLGLCPEGAAGQTGHWHEAGDGTEVLGESVGSCVGRK